MVDVVTAQHFRDWLEAAKPGDAMVYHRGSLASAVVTLSRVRDLRHEVQRAAGLNTRTLIHGQQCVAQPELAEYFDHKAPRYVDVVQRARPEGTEYVAIMRRDHAPHAGGSDDE